MSERRIAGALTFARKYEFITDLHQIHEDSWDDRFHLNKLTAYNPSHDKYNPHKSKHSIILRSFDRLATRSLGTSSTQSLPKALSSPSSLAKRNTLLNNEQLSVLKQELETAWRACQIPDFHIQAFLSRLAGAKPYSITSSIVKEIEELRLGKCSIQEIMSVVQAREEIVKRLEELAREIKGEEPMRSIQQLEAVELLAELRLKSILVVENIMKWREKLDNYHINYQLNGENYFDKMKRDVLFIPNSSIAELVNLPDNFSTFIIQAPDIRSVVSISRNRGPTGSKISVPISHHLLSKVKQAQNIISKSNTIDNSRFDLRSYNPSSLAKSSTHTATLPSFKNSSESFNKQRSSLPINIRSKQRTAHTGKRIVLKTDHRPNTIKQDTPRIVINIKHENDHSADVSIENLPDDIMNKLCEMIIDGIMIHEIDNKVSPIVTECFNEMVAASLVLFSSSVLDKCIQEILNEQIPQIANEGYNEILDSEYIDFQAQILAEVMKEELSQVCEDCTVRILSDQLTEEYAQSLDIETWVNESIQEEVNWNEKIIIIVFEKLMEELVAEEWVEILAEEEVSDARMEQNWTLLPPNIQKQLLKSEGSKIQAKLYEKIWFDILNNVIGSTWVRGIVKECEDEIRTGECCTDLDEIMPLGEFDGRGIRRARKTTLLTWKARS